MISAQSHPHILSVSLSPSELCGYGRREESLLPVSRPLRPEQPAGPSVQSHPLEEDGEFNTIAPRSSGRRSEELFEVFPCGLAVSVSSMATAIRRKNRSST